MHSALKAKHEAMNSIPGTKTNLQYRNKDPNGHMAKWDNLFLQNILLPCDPAITLLAFIYLKQLTTNAYTKTCRDDYSLIIL